MSTILKALRRLEEDGSVADASDPVAEVGGPPRRSHGDASLPATDPGAADELRERILAEEMAAEAVAATQARPEARKRLVYAAAAFCVAFVLGLGLWALVGGPGQEAEPVSEMAEVSDAQRAARAEAAAREAEAAADLAAERALAAAVAVHPTRGRVVRVDPRAAPASIPEPVAEKTEAPPQAVSPPPVVAMQARPESPASTSGPAPVARAASPEVGGEQMERAAVTPTRAARSADRRTARAVEDLPVAQRSTSTPARDASSASARTARTARAAPADPSTEPPAARPPAVASKAPIADPDVEPIARAVAQADVEPDVEPGVEPGVEPDYAPVDPQPLVAAVADVSSGGSPGESRPATTPRQAVPVKRPELPDLAVVRTSWHPASDRRSAKVRLEKTGKTLTLREGDAVGGLVVKEISPSAVLFAAGEVEIRRRVGQGASRN